MQADPEYLRQHFASLSDEALQAIDPADLVETAQRWYDEEVKRREQTSRRDSRRRDGGGDDEQSKVDAKPHASGDKPSWIEDASEVFARAEVPGTAPAPELASARAALEAAGISCYLEVSEIPEEEPASKPTQLWRLLVPGELNLRATSILERDVFNADIEADWKTHLETLSNDELLEMHPEVVFCGLFDRIERVTRAYDDEIARRKLKL